MTHYKLDVSKWRSGGLGENRTGIGDTAMLNNEGCMCCLGQFAKQKGVSDDDLINTPYPNTVNLRTGKRYDQAFVHNGKDTKLAEKLMEINDGDGEYESLTPKQRVDAIRAELKKHGHYLTVIGYKSLK